MLDFIKNIIKFIRKIVRWGTNAYLVIIVIAYVWITLSPPEESVVLSVVVSDENEAEDFGSMVDEISLIASQEGDLLMEIGRLLVREYNADSDLLTDELIDLDNNESTFEVLYFEGELNVSIESFHPIWVVQHRNEPNSAKVILHDTNTTFPIVIKKNSSKKWADIETKVLDNRTKYWRYTGGEYNSLD